MDSKYQKKKDIINKTKELQTTLKISNTHLLNSSLQVITTILSEAKNQPWWLHVTALSSYAGWLYTHSFNVSMISVMIAKKLDGKDLEEIALGAFLHDVGKLKVPKSIIQKPGRLTEEEFFIVRQHCNLGICMVKDFNLPQISLDIIYQHHERLDGSGYPMGLCDAQIPAHSRIVIIADILDAITSCRPYRSERPIESAVDELRKDPAKYPQEILDAFDSLLSISKDSPYIDTKSKQDL